MEQLIQSLATQYPWLIGIFATIGVLRTINKPLFALLRMYVASTAGEEDDEILNKVEKSKAYIWFSNILDYVGSIKLPSKK